MNRQHLFLDTVYVEAGVNARDQWHHRAAVWERHLVTTRCRLITTEYVVFEIANSLASQKHRRTALGLIRRMYASPDIEIVPASSNLFNASLELYEKRPDKDWGLTDCASFVVMQERNVSDALTADEHFGQAGFRPLLLEEPPAG
jgi:predicted nucleic acid-binding protein